MQPDCLTKDNRLIYVHKQIAGEFNNFFRTIAKNINKKDHNLK